MEQFVRIAIGSFVEEHPDVLVPENVYLIGHFTRADLPAFAGFKNQARELMSNVRNHVHDVGELHPCDGRGW